MEAVVGTMKMPAPKSEVCSLTWSLAVHLEGEDRPVYHPEEAEVLHSVEARCHYLGYHNSARRRIDETLIHVVHLHIVR